jgi:hypothetical protein
VSSNSGDSSASRTHVFTVWWISRNLLLVNCQSTQSTISSQPSLQSSTQLPTLNSTVNWTGQLICLQGNSSEQTTSKKPFLYCCARVRTHRNVFAELLLRNGLHNLLIYCCVRACMHVVGVTYKWPLFAESPLSNRSICHNIFDIFVSFLWTIPWQLFKLLRRNNTTGIQQDP